MPLVDPESNITVDWSSLDLDTFVKIVEIRNFVASYKEKKMKEYERTNRAR